MNFTMIPAMKVVDDGRMVRAWIELKGIDQRGAIRLFADPALVREWWGGELEAEPEPGGGYVVRFESQGWTLHGQVVSYEPESGLTFTWAWEHQPDDPPREVKVTAVPAGTAATRLEIEHGPHGDSESELVEAVAHREGWEYFLPRMADCLAR
jgi:uncharacterized protein YndB with AHSA1/START domain